MAKQRKSATKPARRRDKKGGPGSGRRKPCPYCKDKIELVDYKDVTRPAPLRLRARQDPLAPHHGRVPPAPEPDRDRRQARPRAGAAALRRRARVARASAAAAAVTAIGTGTSAMPEAILLKDVDGVGSRGAVVDVSKGYLRNFLIPRKLAAPATKGLLREAERNQDAYNKATRATRIAAGPGARRAAQQDGPDDLPAGRRGRPPVRLGHHPGHRRRDQGGPRHRRRPPQDPPRRRRSRTSGPTRSSWRSPRASPPPSR